MEQPTKEEIDDMVATINRDGLEGLTRQEVRELCDAYLALKEEVDGLRSDQEKIGKYIAGLCEQDFQKTKRIESLQADNQALKDEHGRLKDQLSLHMKNAAEAIAEVEAENQALRAQLDAFNPGSLIQPANYSYVTDYATGDTDAEGGQP